MRSRTDILRLVALFTLTSFLWNCIGHKRVVIRPEEPIPIEKKLVAIHWQDNTYVLRDVAITGHVLEGTVFPTHWKRISKRKLVHVYVDKPLETQLKNREQFSIAITEFARVEYYSVDAGKTIAYTFLGLVGVFAVALIIIALTKESCPFVYAYNGETFEFEGEIYSGAIYPSLERHDYLLLQELHPVKDDYHIKLTNEVKEIQYTNLAELQVVDHELNSEVLIDKYGALHTLSALQQPHRAQSLIGENISTLVTQKDNLIYTGDLQKQGKKLMDGMILSFRKPTDTDSAKLVIRAKNSFWFDYAFGLFSNQFGDFYDTWREMQKAVPAAQLRKWAEDQGIPLSVYVEKNSEWQFADYFNLAGPMALKNDVLALDFSGITSDNVRVKLEYGFSFWEIDYVAMDFSKNRLVHKQTVSLSSAIDQDNQDVSELLLQDDNKYQVLAEVGQQVALKFPVPQARPGMQRSIFLHSKGHYEAIRNPQGVADLAYLEAFRQPGRFIEFSKTQLRKLVMARRN